VPIIRHKFKVAKRIVTKFGDLEWLVKQCSWVVQYQYAAVSAKTLAEPGSSRTVTEI